MSFEIFWAVLLALIAYRMIRPAIDSASTALWASSDHASTSCNSKLQRPD